jgi:hypothetical protein
VLEYFILCLCFLTFRDVSFDTMKEVVSSRKNMLLMCRYCLRKKEHDYYRSLSHLIKSSIAAIWLS